MTETAKTGINLIPDKVNESPDYFCTWQAQLFCCNNTGPQGQRDCMTERSVFGTDDEAADRKEGIGWAKHLYKDARRDLIFLMDDAWDVPIGGLINKDPWWGSHRLAPDKFPSFCGKGVENRDAMKARERAAQGFSKLDESRKRLYNPHSYPVGLEAGLFVRRRDLAAHLRGLK